MTVEGAKKLREELHQLKAVERPRIVTAIAEARGHGDLKENAEYHAAKEEQGFLEARIREIEGKLAQAEIINVTTFSNHGKVVFGSTVTLVNLETEQKVIYRIVGEDEADLKERKISITSPLSRALIGKQEGEQVDVCAPAGIISYEISQVGYI